jgi:hypothetical protein
VLFQDGSRWIQCLAKLEIKLDAKIRWEILNSLSRITHHGACKNLVIMSVISGLFIIVTVKMNLGEMGWYGLD